MNNFRRQSSSIRRFYESDDIAPRFGRVFSWVGRIFAKIARTTGLARFSRNTVFSFGRWAFRIATKYRRFVRGNSASWSDYFGRAVEPGGIGEKLLIAAYSRINSQPLLAHLILKFISAMLGFAIEIHIAAGQKARALKSARLLNLLFRPRIRRRMPIAYVYFQVLFWLAYYDRITREVHELEWSENYYFNFSFGVSYLYTMRPEMAVYFLERSTEIAPDSWLAHRMLGRCWLAMGQLKRAAKSFSSSVDALPGSVMAHGNYAGRYDINSYQPKQWELDDAGDLLVYDNFLQFAEDLFLLGRYDDSFRFYQKALRYQHFIALGKKLPRRLIQEIIRQCPQYDRRKQLRILSYEWVVQFGHIGLLDSYVKMARLGYYPDANYVLLAPAEKVANEEFLKCWAQHFCIVRDNRLVGDIFPYQRYFGDQFIAYPAHGRLAEPWSHAAARAHVEWSKRGLAPVVALREEDRLFGEKELEKLGVPESAWYVGLHVREGGFYSDGAGTSNEHRNARIEDYIPAIEEITSRGGWVIRLGDASMKSLPKMPQVIEYPLSKSKSQRMDLFFLAKCRMIIGTTSGLTTAALSFGTPMVLVNCISSDSQMWPSNTHFIVKPLYSKHARRNLTLGETYRQPTQGILISAPQMERKGLVALANTADDIRDAVRYKLDLVIENKPDAGEDHPTIRAYRNEMRDNPFVFGAARPVLPFLEAHPELLAEKQASEYPAAVAV